MLELTAVVVVVEVITRLQLRLFQLPQATLALDT
jgi:hypothetical protein